MRTDPSPPLSASPGSSGAAWRLALAVALLPGAVRSASAASGTTSRFDKPAPVTVEQLDRSALAAVSAVEVDDYRPGHYAGPLTPSPPHADLNPQRAVIVCWKNRPERLVFSHEASYCPLLELPDGAAMCDQFFEGNLGEAELFNSNGRKEKNSFVDVIQNGPARAWVRWTYFAVNQKDDAQPRLRGTEDYFACSNGLILRRLTYESLMPGAVVGYSTQPVELFGVAPRDATLASLFPEDPAHHDFLTLAAQDLYSDQRYEIYWSATGSVRRHGDDDTLDAIARSRGCALVLPFKQELLFAILGPASGFPADMNQLIDHCTPGARGGLGWGTARWDHWPVGWLNSQASDWTPASPYPYSFGSIGQFFVPAGKRITSFRRDYPVYCEDMALNRWTAGRVFYVLLGAARDWAEIRRIGRGWLDQGPRGANPDSIAELR